MTLEEQASSFMYLNIRRNARVSLAVALADDFDIGGAVIADGLRVFLKENPVSAVRNFSGYFVFTNLPDNDYTVCVTAKNYFTTEVPVSLKLLDPAEPVVTIRLKPKPAYPFPTGATLARGVVCDGQGSRICGASVQAVLAGNIMAKLSSKGLHAQEDSMGVVSVTRRIYAGDTFLISDKTEADQEYCTVAATPELTNGIYTCKLTKLVQNNHNRGAALVPVVDTLTDEKGELVLYFRNTLTKNFAANIIITYGEQKMQQEIQVAEGTTVSLGVVGL